MRGVWVAGASLLGAGILVSACSAKDKMQEVCIEALKERLKSPSSFKLAEASYYEEPLDLQEQKLTLQRALRNATTELETTAAELDIAMFENDVRRGKTPVRRTIFIEYDSDNSYGASIRGLAQCEYDSDDAASFAGNARSVLINSQDHHEWFMDQIRTIGN